MPDEPNAELSASTVHDEASCFHGYMLHACAKVSNAGKRQLFWTTWNATFHGLSRIGLFLQSQLGFMSKPSTFDLMRDAEREETLANVE